MQISEIDSIGQYQHLKQVSRSFALTIPLLPQPLSDYVSNAYLLCRIADTVEDDPLALKENKISWLRNFCSFSQEGFDDDMKLLTLHKQALDMLKGGANPDEFALIKDLPAVVYRTLSFPAKIKPILSKGVAILCKGMAASLQGRPICNLDDVDRYCYFVAGVVGELLAALFCEHNRNIPKEELMDLAVSFGEGLQLTNILKDRYADSKRGASFLPKPSGGDTAREIVLYSKICQGHLEDALEFICLIPKQERGIRMFCLLNICMAAATLKLIRDPEGKTALTLKISRRKVKLLFGLSSLCSGSNIMSRLLFRLTSLGSSSTRRSASLLRKKVSLWDKSQDLVEFNEDKLHD